MFFLLRMAFWLTVILALLPVFVGHEDSQAQSTTAKFDAGEAVGAAAATVSDLGQFCSRRPEACAIGFQAAAAVGASAQAGAKILYGYLQDKSAEPGVAGKRNAGTRAALHKPAQEKAINEKSAANKSMTTGSTSAKTSQDTLFPTDLAPPWRGSSQPKDSGAKRPA
jgi:hypothetical protein